MITGLERALGHAHADAPLDLDVYRRRIVLMQRPQRLDKRIRGDHRVLGHSRRCFTVRGSSTKAQRLPTANSQRLIALTVVNRLADETSPYLLQHAHNPVDWYPWGEAALARAKAEDKPILLSIGYSACHWCHAM